MDKPKLIATAACLAIAAGTLAGAGSASAATLLCNENKAPCPEAKTYPVGTLVKGTLVPNTVTTFKGGGILNVTCKKSEIEASTTVAAGIPLTAKVGGPHFEECAGPFCAAIVKPLNQPYLGEIEAIPGGNGEMAVVEGTGGGFPRATFECGAVKCEYGAGEIPLEAFGGAPAQIKANEANLVRVAGPEMFCPAIVKWSAQYRVVMPNPVFVI